MPRSLPFNDLRLSQRAVRPAMKAAFRRVMEGGSYILGPEVKRFEKDFARNTGARYCVGVGSGTDAITLALQALGIGRGDEVITSALTSYPTITGISRSGARPVLVDVLPGDALIDPALVRKAVTRRTRAIVPVHLYGQSCDMTLLTRVTRQYGLKIVEDCAQSAGALYRGRKTGSIGDCGAFSFYPTKNLGALGDGGAVTTRHAAVYRKLLRLRDYGRVRRDVFRDQGCNSRLDEIQAAFLRVKLPRLEEWVRNRRRLAGLYRKHLAPGLLLDEHDERRHAYHLFVIRVPRRRRILKALQAEGIGTSVHYPRPVHREAAFVWPVRGDFPQASRLCREVLSLPLYPGMREGQVLQVVRCLREALED